MRRGAIAALEREWSGNERVGAALLKVVRTDGHMRVRQAAIEALQEGWSLGTDLLSAIESRIGRESSYTYVLWLLEYLALNWRGNSDGLRLVVKIVDVSWPRFDRTIDDRICSTGVRAVATAWEHHLELETLFNRWSFEEMPQFLRVTSIRTLGGVLSESAEAVLLDIFQPRARRAEPASKCWGRFSGASTRSTCSSAQAFLRAVSTRQVGAVLAPVLGWQPSAQTVSTIAKALDQEGGYHWRRVGDDWVYLLLDGVTMKVKHPAACRRSSSW